MPVKCFYALDDRVLLSDDQESSGSHYDGNVFWQKNSGRPMFANFARSANFTSLAELRTSGTIWETHGLRTDPGFDTAKLLELTFERAAMWSHYVPTNREVFTRVFRMRN